VSIINFVEQFLELKQIGSAIETGCSSRSCTKERGFRDLHETGDGHICETTEGELSIRGTILPVTKEEQLYLLRLTPYHRLFAGLSLFSHHCFKRKL
jgi:hypothetical protein